MDFLKRFLYYNLIYLNIYEILKIYENNLIQLMENCPTDKLNEILAEINKQTVKKDNVEKIKSDKNK